MILFAVYNFTYPSFENVCDFIFYVQTLDSAKFMCVYWLENLVLIFLLVIAQSTNLHSTVSRTDSAQIYRHHISTAFGSLAGLELFKSLFQDVSGRASSFSFIFFHMIFFCSYDYILGFFP